jgi:hypothetical protein
VIQTSNSAFVALSIQVRSNEVIVWCDEGLSPTYLEHFMVVLVEVLIIGSKLAQWLGTNWFK